MEHEMEHENPQAEAVETVNDDSSKKVTNKNNKQATVLKQLSNQNLYPIQERIGIYLIAILSTVGLALIIYTGVMALINTVIPDEQVVEARPDLDMDLDVIDDILGDVADALDTDDEDDETEFQQDQADLHEYVDPEEDEPEGPMPTHGVVNSDMVDFMSLPGSGNRHGWLHTGDEVTILQLDYNTYWSRIESAIDFGSGPVLIQGFIYRHLLDPEW